MTDERDADRTAFDANDRDGRLMRVEPVSRFAALALHGLAHVPLSGVESLFDPNWIAWCARTMPRDAREPLAADGPRIGAEADHTGARGALQWLPRLHGTLGAFERTSRRDLETLGPGDVDDVAALRALRSATPIAIEWLRSDLALAARSFGAWLDAAPLDDACTAIATALALAPESARPPVVQLAWSLGPRGRGFDDAVVVGAPAAWNGLDARTAAAIALHEHAVVRAGGDHVTRERAAVDAVARALAGGPLQRAHAAWLATLVIP